MEDKTFQNLPRISPSLLKDVDTSAPISYNARLGWEELLGVPADPEHYIFKKRKHPKCLKAVTATFFKLHSSMKRVLQLKMPKNENIIIIILLIT